MTFFYFQPPGRPYLSIVDGRAAEENAENAPLRMRLLMLYPANQETVLIECEISSDCELTTLSNIYNNRLAYIIHSLMQPLS